MIDQCHIMRTIFLWIARRQKPSPLVESSQKYTPATFAPFSGRPNYLLEFFTYMHSLSYCTCGPICCHLKHSAWNASHGFGRFVSFAQQKTNLAPFWFVGQKATQSPWERKRHVFVARSNSHALLDWLIKSAVSSIHKKQIAMLHNPLTNHFMWDVEHFCRASPDALSKTGSGSNRFNNERTVWYFHTTVPFLFIAIKFILGVFDLTLLLNQHRL